MLCSNHKLSFDLPPSSPPSPSQSPSPRARHTYQSPKTPVRKSGAFLLEIRSPSSSTSEYDRTIPSFEFSTPPRLQRLCCKSHEPDLDDGLQLLRDIRIMTEAWVSHFGPMAEWPRLFQKRYDEACEPGQEPSAFLKAVEAHALEGREILRLLRGSSIVRPPVSHAAWGDYLAAGDMLDRLYHGVSMLEVRLDLLAPRVPRSADVDSEIRHWDSLSGLVMGRSYSDIMHDTGWQGSV